MIDSNNFGRTTNTDQYGFVPFPTEAVPRATMQGFQHHRWDPNLCHGVWTFELTTHSPLLIHAGMDENGHPKAVGVSDAEGPGKSNPIPKSFLKSKHPDHLGQPVIPGSSLKGMVRSVYEILTHSCGFQICENYDQEPENLDPSFPPKPCTSIQALCPSCRMFGWMIQDKSQDDDNQPSAVCFGGRVAICDALPSSNRPIIFCHDKWLPVMANPIPKDRSTSNMARSYYVTISNPNDPKGKKKIIMRGRKRYFANLPTFSEGKRKSRANLSKMSPKPAESVSEGQSFQFKVYFHNLTHAERDVLLACFLLEEDQLHLLGAAKNHGWGKVSLRLVDGQSFNPTDRYKGGTGMVNETERWQSLNHEDLVKAKVAGKGTSALYHEAAAQNLAPFQTKPKSTHGPTPPQ